MYKGDSCRFEVSAMMVSEWVGVSEVGLVACDHLIIIDLIRPQHCQPENSTYLRWCGSISPNCPEQSAINRGSTMLLTAGMTMGHGGEATSMAGLSLT